MIHMGFSVYSLEFLLEKNRQFILEKKNVHNHSNIAIRDYLQCENAYTCIYIFDFKMNYNQ